MLGETSELPVGQNPADRKVAPALSCVRLIRILVLFRLF